MPDTLEEEPQEQTVDSILGDHVTVKDLLGEAPSDAVTPKQQALKDRLDEQERNRMPTMSQAPTPGVVSRAAEATGEFLSPLTGPTEQQVEREGVYNPTTKQMEYKPLGSAVEREGLFPAASHPFIPLPKFKVDKTTGVTSAVLKSLANQGIGLAEFMESPLGVATGGMSAFARLPKTAAGAVTGTREAIEAARLARTATRVASGGFAADIASKVPETARRAGETSVTGTPGEAAAADVGLAAEIALPGLLTAHAADGEGPPIDPEAARLLPRAAAEVAKVVPVADQIAAIDKQLAEFEKQHGPRMVYDEQTKRLVPNPDTIRPSLENELVKRRDALSEQLPKTTPDVKSGDRVPKPTADEEGFKDPTNVVEFLGKLPTGSQVVRFDGSIFEKDSDGTWFHRPEIKEEGNSTVDQHSGGDGSGLQGGKIRRIGKAVEPTKTEVSDASGEQKAAEVHGDVRPQPVEGEGKVPVEEGGKRVQPDAEAPVGDVSLKLGGAEEGAAKFQQAQLEAKLDDPATFKGKNWTADALKYGAELDPSKPEAYEHLKALEKRYADEMKGMKKTPENLNRLMQLSSMKQWVTEALQGAEGIGERDVAREVLGKDYEPPFPKEKVTATSAFDPAQMPTQEVPVGNIQSSEDVPTKHDQIRDIIRSPKELEQELRKEGWNVSPVKIAGSKNLVDYWDIHYRAKKISEASSAEEGWNKIADGKVQPPEGPTEYQKFVQSEIDKRKASEPLQLDKPESVEEQKAREAKEAADRAKKAQAGAAQEGAAKPLSGSTGDIGQLDMLGGNELPLPAGPGAASRPGAKVGTDIGGHEFNIPPLETLADAVSRFPKQKTTFKQKWQEWLDQNIPAKDTFARALATAKAWMGRLVNAATKLPEVMDIERRVGRWDAEDQEGSLASHRFAQAVRKQFPDRSKLRALSNWINAGGDRELLRRWAAATKDPKLRKSYEDAVKFGPEEEKLADSVRNYHDQMLAWAQREGVLEEGVEDYIHRFYPRDGDPRAEKLNSALRYLRFTKDFAGFKKRFYDSDFEAEQAGLKPEKDAATRILAYDQGFRRALTARAFVKDSFDAMATPEKLPNGDVIHRPEMDVVGTGVRIEAKPGQEGKTSYLIKPKSRPDSGDPADYRGDYVTFDHPAFRKWKFASKDENGNPILVQGDIVVHPEFAKKYAALFEKSWWSKTPTRRAAIGLSSGVKQTMLSVSGFHPVQIAIHALEHKVNPFKLVDLNLRDPAQRELVEGGLSVADTKGAQYFSEGVGGVGLLGKVPLAGEFLQRINNWLFKDYIPRIKMTMAQAALERNLGNKSYFGVESQVGKDFKAGKLTREQVVRLTAREANAAFGEQNYRAMFRHPSFQDTLRAIFLAPDFGEARLKFPLQALTKYGGEQRSALIVGAVGMFVVAKMIEKSLTGEMHLTKPFSVTYKNHEYGLRNVASDLWHLGTDPQGYIRNRLNPIYTRPILEFISGRDRFGKKRTMGEQMIDQLKQVMPISVRGLVEKDQRIWESFLNAMGITERRDTQFGDVMKDVNKWKEKKGYTQPGEFVYDADKDPYHPLTQELSFGNDERAARELRKLMAGKSQPEKTKVLEHYRRSLVQNHFLTGSRVHEAEYLKGLGAQGKQQYEDAKKERQAMWERFKRIWGTVNKP